MRTRAIPGVKWDGWRLRGSCERKNNGDAALAARGAIMKLASVKDSNRDGRLVVVSRDLRTAAVAEGVAATLQEALDDWERAAPELQALYERLNAGNLPGAQPFESQACGAPLPRAFQWADSSAYLYHVELVRRARGASMPPEFLVDPIIYQGGSDTMLGPNDDICLADEDWGIDFEAELVVVTGDVRMGASSEACAREIRLLMLANDVSLRNLIPGELAKGFGFFQSKPSTAFGPVAVTPDELGSAWDGGRAALQLQVYRGKQQVGNLRTAEDMHFTFPRIMSHAARTRGLSAGSIVGAGTVSNRAPAAGYACIAERRAMDTIERGSPVTPYLRFGERVRIEAFDSDGNSVFGAIDQSVVPYEGGAR